MDVEEADFVLGMVLLLCALVFSLASFVEFGFIVVSKVLTVLGLVVWIVEPVRVFVDVKRALLRRGDG